MNCEGYSSPCDVKGGDYVAETSVRGVYVDATVGLGGHAEEILRHIGHGRLLGIDRDEEALDMAMKRIPDNRLTLKKGKFSDISKMAAETGFSEVDGILFDLGTSMFHLKTAERGFSFFQKSLWI